MKINLSTYSHNNIITLYAETKETFYEVDVYQSGAFQSRINCGRVAVEVMNKYHYGATLLQFAMDNQASALALLSHDNHESPEYREAWWAMKQLCDSYK